MNFVVGRCAAVIDVPVDGEAVLVFVRDVGRTLAQFLANLLSHDKRRRPRVAETQHEENHAQQRHLQSSINRQRGIVPAVARRYATPHCRWQKLRQIYIRLQTVHLWWSAVAKLQAASMPTA